MATVHTAFGPGEIIASETVRGRIQHKVAVNGNEIWVDEAKLGITRVADAFAWQPPEQDSYGHPHPDDPASVNPHFDALGDEDPYGEFGNELGGALSPQEFENPGYNKHAPGYDPHRDYSAWEDGGMGDEFDGGRAGEIFNNAPHSFGRGVEDASLDAHRLGWAPVDHDNSVNLPYDPTPQYPAIPGDTESTLQPIHEIDADERLSPADSITFEDREEPEAGEGVGMFADNFEKASARDIWDEGYRGEDAPRNVDTDPKTGLDRRPGWDEEQEHRGSVHEAFAFLIPLAEGLAGAGAAEGGAAAAGGAAEAGGMGGGMARGVAQGVGRGMVPGGGQGGDPSDKIIDELNPGPGWGPLQVGASLDTWLDSRREASETHNLDDRYIDITADVDYYNDPVAQFRHDPSAYIARLGHVEYEPASPEMEHYGQLVEADANVREAAWVDVRQKAMRLRREGRVHVKDVDSDRIYASVDGDHGTYDVMIAKKGAYGGLGGGHTITNWRCACEWGRWAFQRQMTYVGRLCSHGYAAYLEMQSSHMKGKPRTTKLPRYKRADALQSIPQRLVPELIINDSEDEQQFLDVEKDERKDTGPDDIISDTDIVHFARVLTACDQNDWPYPRELVAFLERLGEDQQPEDWKIEDAGSAAGSALNEIRDWADTPQSEDIGHMEERTDDIRDAVQDARDGGTDADQLVAFRTAVPGGQPRDLQDLMGVQPQQTPLAPGFQPGDLSSYPGVAGGSNTTPVGPLPNVSGTADYGGNVSSGTPDPTGGMMSAPYGAPAPGKGGGNPPLPTNNTGGGSQGGAGGGPPIQGPGIGNHDQGKAGGDTPSNAIGQGQYTINQGDTLSDIAQRSGYGGDYSSLAQQNQIADPDRINAGDTINIGKPGDGGGGEAGGGKAPQATENPATNAPGGPVNQNSGGAGADEGSGAAAPPAANPAQTGSNPATPQNTPQVDTGAAGGSPGGQVDISAVPGGSSSGGGDIGGGSTTPDAAPASQQMPDMSGVSDAINSGVGMASDLLHSFTGSRNIFADQADYDEWVRYAYPEIGPGSHKPFAGSGPRPPLEYSTSEEYADKARKKMDDVTDIDYDITKDVNPKQSSVGGGIHRAGHGPRRTVVPEVVREQKVNNGRTAAYVPDEFDPLAPRTASSFDDPYSQADADAAAVLTAANGGDIVANFQRSAGAQAVMSSAPSQQDNFDIAGAANQFLTRTAGRNYSLAEQAELIREGDIGGASNLGSLDLSGTHYEAENSIGLFT